MYRQLVGNKHPLAAIHRLTALGSDTFDQTVENEMMRITATILVTMSLAVYSPIHAQRVYTNGSPSGSCYAKLVFEESAIHPKGVIILDAPTANIGEFATQNAFIRADTGGSFNFLYISLISTGSESKSTCYEVVAKMVAAVHRINPKVFFLLQPAANPSVLISPLSGSGHYRTVHYQDTSLGQVYGAMQQELICERYRVPEIGETEAALAKTRMENYRRNFDLSFSIAPTALMNGKLGMTKDAIASYGVSISKNIGGRHAVRLSLTGSAKIPSQKKMQSEMQSKLMSAVQNGDDSFILAEKLSGHMLLGLEIGYKYFFTSTGRYRPYVAVGIGSYMNTVISGSIRDTIDISGVDMSNPSTLQNSMSGDIGNSANNDALTNLSLAFSSLSIEPGLECRLSPNAKGSVSLPFRSWSNATSPSYNTLSLSLNMTLSFVLNARKVPGLRNCGTAR